MKLKVDRESAEEAIAVLIGFAIVFALMVLGLNIYWAWDFFREALFTNQQTEGWLWVRN